MLSNQLVPPAPRYRPEIDGLRAVAVLGVLIFHLDIPYMRGGFTGVDLFFVISGFLITSILLREMDEGRFSLARFYRRRALRILPPLVVMLLVTMLIASRIMLPSELDQLGRTTAAAITSLSNIQLWLEVDYFTPDAHENPLLHTWSLGIEEQFYIIVPLLLWGLSRFAKRARLAVFALSVALSFGWSLWLVPRAPSASFYLLPTRYWELGIGALLAMIGPARIIGGLSSALPRPLKLGETRLRALAGGVGLLLVAASLIALPRGWAFPGAAALPATLGAALIILGGTAGPVGWLLSRRVVLALGAVSYSLYLWHWPLIVFWKLRFGADLSATDIALLAAASLALATLSTRFIERPFRQMKAPPDWQILGGACASIAALLALGVGLAHNGGHLRHYPQASLITDDYADYRDNAAFIEKSQRNICFLLGDTPDRLDAFDRQRCLGEGAPAAKPTLLLIGDSLAAHIWGAIAEGRPDMTVLQATSAGCTPAPQLASDLRATPLCKALMDFVYDDWLPQNPPDHVVFSARWREWHLPGLLAAIERMQAAGVKKITVLGPTLEYTSPLPKLLARDSLLGTDLAPLQVKAQQWQISALMAQRLKGMAGVQYIDLLPILCRKGRENGCQSRVAGVPIQFDYGHYTVAGARFVVSHFAQAL